MQHLAECGPCTRACLNLVSILLACLQRGLPAVPAIQHLAGCGPDAGAAHSADAEGCNSGMLYRQGRQGEAD
eukprot:1140216-Pelagomonas_calceolata.AAC.5